LDWTEKKLGAIKRNTFRRAAGLPIGTHIDAIVVSSGEPIEAKTAGIVNPFIAKDIWGAENTDEVPDHVVVQAQVHLLCTLKELCHIPALIGGRGRVMFRVVADKELQQIISEAAETFWQHYVVKDVPPDHTLPSMESIRRVIRTPKEVVAIDPLLVKTWQESDAAAKIANRAADEAKQRVLAQLGTAEAGQFDGGIVTYYEQSRKGYVVKDSVYRVARIKLDKPELAPAKEQPKLQEVTK
jgi:hypothetical protein